MGDRIEELIGQLKGVVESKDAPGKKKPREKETISLPKLTEELHMVGFRPAGRYRPVVLARIRACREYDPRAPEGGVQFPVKIEVWISKVGQEQEWLKSGAFEKAVTPLAKAAIEKEGMFPKDPKGYSVEPACVGLAEIGAWHEQQAYSDDSFLGLRADSSEIAKYVKEAISKVLPVSGGGVPGSLGYRGSGWRGQDNEWVYHYYSFGIGD